MVPLKEMEGLLRRLMEFDRLAEELSKRERAIPPIFKIVALVVFAQTIFTRAVDPVIPMIAADLAIDVKTAALLSTAFAFPYALIQPVLGVTGDFFGKTRLMNACVLVMAIAALICAVATNFSLLVAMRIVAGLVAGGVFPVAMALLGDLVPINQRQVAIARLLGIALTANVLGASISGVIGDLFGWRGVFAILGTFSLAVSRSGVLGAPQHDIGAAAAVQPRRGRRQLPRRVRRSARQGLLRRRVPRSDLHPGTVSVRRASCCARSARPAPRSPAF